jgi:TonB-dependent starch-binding outer membrane protein SusC
MQKSAVTQQTWSLFYSKTKTLCFVMRVSSFLIILIILTANLLRAADGFGQGIEDKTISLELHNESLRNALNKIEELSGYRMAYVLEEVAGYSNINLGKETRTVKKTLELVLNNTPLEFKQQDVTILIYHRGRRDIGIVINDTAGPYTLAADTTVRGRVTTVEGEALEGVTVSVKGDKITTVTNAQGYFDLKKVSGDAVLIISYIGYEPQEFKVEKGRNLTVKLVRKGGRILDEVVVSTGYQKLNKERFIGSVTKIDSALLHRQIGVDVISRLDGVTNSLLFDKRTGTPRLQLRGINTLQGGDVEKPLIILDDFEYTGDINNINPNDVQDISILKDAVAASIWGAKAGNGVIVISTKKGKYNQSLQTSFIANTNVQEKPNLYYIPQMSTSDFIDVQQYLFNNGYYNSVLTDNINYPVVPLVAEILNKKANGTLPAAIADAQINSLRSLDVRNDYERYVLRDGINQQYSLNFGGGTSQIKYNFSLGYDDNTSQIKGKGGEFHRYSVNSNTSFKPFKVLEVTAGINFSKIVTTANNLAIDQNLAPYTQLADAEGNHLAVPKTYRASFIDTAGAGGKLLDWHYVPLDEMNLGDSKIVQQYYQLNLKADLRFASWLNGTLIYQYNQQTSDQRDYNDVSTYVTRDLINRYTQPGTFKRNIPLGGTLGLDDEKSVGYHLRGQLNFNKTWNGKHAITALIATEVSEENANSNSNLIYGYNDNTLSYQSNTNYDLAYPVYVGNTSLQIPNGLSLSETTNRSVSFLGNASYTYNERYNFYTSARKDGSNIFGVKTNNKWKPLWSVGAGWKLSKESFYHVNWLPYLGLRVSYGYTGNSVNTISALRTIRYDPTLNPFTGTQSAFIISPPNSNLRWEEVQILNLGVDFGIKNGRLSGSFEWYQKKSSDVLAEFPIDATTGETSVTHNAANLSGKGVDLALNSKNLVGYFRWNTVFNFNYSKTIVTNYFQNFVATPGGSPSINPHVGQIAYGLYSYRWAGLDPTTGDPQGYLNGHVSKDYVGIINDSFQHQIFNGSSLPLYFGNILNSFSWKGLSLSANITYRLDYYFEKPSLSYTRIFSGTDLYADYSKRWQKPGDELITNIPSLIYPNNSNRDLFYQNAEVNIERADNIRLADIRLSYDWNFNNLRHIPIRNLSVFLYVSNLNLVIWKANHSGIDPDFTSYTASIPPARIWAAGVSVQLK